MLEHAYRQHSPMMTWLKVDPRFEDTASDAFHAGEVALLDPRHCGEDPRGGRIVQAIEPRSERALPLKIDVLLDRGHR